MNLTHHRIADTVDAHAGHHGHGLRVAALSIQLAEHLDIPAPAQQRLATAALLHDVGKLRINSTTLTRATPLNDLEERALREHPEHSHTILVALGLPVEAEVARLHHERPDGHGYIGTTTVPLIAAIIRVADAYDAMTHTRPYRQAIPRADAVTQLLDPDAFDQTVVRALIQLRDRRAIA